MTVAELVRQSKLTNFGKAGRMRIDIRLMTFQDYVN